MDFFFHQTCLHKRIGNDISKHMLKKKINSILARKNHFCNIWHKLYISKKRKRSNSRTFSKSSRFVTQIFCTKFVKLRKCFGDTTHTYSISICGEFMPWLRIGIAYIYNLTDMWYFLVFKYDCSIDMRYL